MHLRGLGYAIIGEQTKRVRHYQGSTNSRNRICVYIYMDVREA